jgi:hypothetical protein
MAAKELGVGYKLYVSSLSISETEGTESVSGIVTAWNDQEVREVPVHWKGTRD